MSAFYQIKSNYSRYEKFAVPWCGRKNLHGQSVVWCILWLKYSVIVKSSFFDFLFVCRCGKDFDVAAHHAKILQAETLHRPKICGSKTKPNYTEYDLDLVSSQFHRTEWTSASAWHLNCSEWFHHPSLQALLTDLSGQPAGLPVRLWLVHSLADLLHQFVQLHRGLNQNRAELLPCVLTEREREKEKLQ